MPLPGVVPTPRTLSSGRLPSTAAGGRLVLAVGLLAGVLAVDAGSAWPAWAGHGEHAASEGRFGLVEGTGAEPAAADLRSAAAAVRRHSAQALERNV
jgi:hypothetical protein